MERGGRRGRHASPAGRRRAPAARGGQGSLSERLVVHVDGGARGNPGPAAIAAVLSDPDGGVVEERAETIGVATNNVAEYRALLLGIEHARALGANELDIVGDSELIARQVRGEYRVKDSTGGRSVTFHGRRMPTRIASSTRRSTRNLTNRRHRWRFERRMRSGSGHFRTAAARWPSEAGPSRASTHTSPDSRRGTEQIPRS